MTRRHNHAAALAALMAGGMIAARPKVSPELAIKARPKAPKVDKRRPDGLTREQVRHLKRMGKLAS